MPNFFESFNLIYSLRFLAHIGGGIALALLLAFFTLHLIKWLVNFRSRHTEKVVNLNIRTPVLIFYPLASIFIVLYLFYPVLFQLPWIQAFAKVIFIILLTWLFLRFIKIFAAIVKRRFDISNANNLRARAVHTQITVIQRIASFSIILLGLASFFLLFEEFRSIGVSLIASAGVAGIVLGLAAQKTLGNLFAGIQIAFSQPIRIDDVVIVEDEWGWIEEITLTYVVVRIWDLRRLILPISYFIEKPFQNWTRNSAEILGTVFLYTDYTIPVEAIREETAKILSDHPKWNGEVNVVQVTECKEQTMEIRILVSAGNSPAAWELRCDVRENLINFIQENYPECLPKTRAALERQETAP